MTFRIRVFALVALVVLIATGASTYLTFILARNEVARSTQTQHRILEQIVEEITAYGRDHGTWEGVAVLAEKIARRTGQRIHLETQDGLVGVVDTALLLKQPVTPITNLTVPIDARAQLELPQGTDDEQAITLAAIEDYRQEIRFAACLTRQGYEPKAVKGRYGMPIFTHTDASAGVVAQCRQFTASQPHSLARDREDLARCGTPGDHPVTGPDLRPETAPTVGEDLSRKRHSCYEEVFLTRISIAGPAPLRLAVDSDEDIDPTLIILAFSVVTIPIMLGTLLLSRHVLRPIQRLTVAARRFGEGALDQRVTVTGSDELAQLGVTFNGMADSLQHSEEQQRRMIADVAHELRTPLANLRAYLEALEDGLVTADAALFRSLQEETLLQQRIVDDLQTLALAEAGVLAYHRSTVDLGELLEHCRAAHQPAAGAVSVGLEVVAEPLVLVQADPDRLRQAVGNLVTNAVRHTPPGTTVTLEAVRAGQAALIRVTDRGPGIPPEDQRRVFNRFWRADRARTRSTGGSGLGLAIARQIAVDHGGTISLVSEAGQGATFTIALPTRDVPVLG